MSPRVIVVDDDLSTLALVHDALAPEGYRVACANTMEAGLCATRQERPDLIILDLCLGTPAAGRRLVDRLRSEARTADVPIIACSADDRALRTHFGWLLERNCATLAKPFDLGALLERVASAIPDAAAIGCAARRW